MALEVDAKIDDILALFDFFSFNPEAFLKVSSTKVYVWCKSKTSRCTIQELASLTVVRIISLCVQAQTPRHRFPCQGPIFGAIYIIDFQFRLIQVFTIVVLCINNSSILFICLKEM